MEDRGCKKCGLTLPLTFFEKSVRHKSGYRRTCETCREKQRIHCLNNHPDGKLCVPCGFTLSLEENFHRLDDGGYYAWCKRCASDRARKRYRQPETRTAALADRAAYRKANREHILERDRATRLNRKIQVWEHYGNGIAACVCCGVNEHEFLTLDHIDANGADHRKELRKSGVGGYATGWFIYKWLIDNGYPDGYQTLCFNCNVGKHRTKINKCPHQIWREALLIGPVRPNHPAQPLSELSRAA